MSQGDTGTSNFKQPKFTWTWLRGYMVCFSFAHGLHLPMLASPFTISSAYPLTPLQALHVGFKLGKKITFVGLFWNTTRLSYLQSSLMFLQPCRCFARASGLVQGSGRFQITSWRKNLHDPKGYVFVNGDHHPRQSQEGQ